MKARTWSLLGKGVCFGGFRTNENKPEFQNTRAQNALWRPSCRNRATVFPVYPIPGPYSAASAFGGFAFLDLLWALAALAAAAFFGFASVLAADLGAALALAAAFAVLGAAALVALSPRAGRFRRALELPLFGGRASIRAAASSSVMVSGVLSVGRLALTPSWLT